MSKYRFTAEERLDILEAVKQSDCSLIEVLSNFGISYETYYQWKRSFEFSGLDGLSPKSKNNSYSVELKLAAVQAYLNAEGSLGEISRKFKIRLTCQLRNWIKKYNGHENTKSYRVGERTMTKGRKTTLNERIEIAGYCIANRCEYQQTADKFNVSYQQVYQWVKKFQDGGSDALRDRRGHSKQDDELSSEEQLKLKLKQLAYANERLKAENHVLKKLQELERGLN